MSKSKSKRALKAQRTIRTQHPLDAIEPNPHTRRGGTSSRNMRRVSVPNSQPVEAANTTVVTSPYDTVLVWLPEGAEKRVIVEAAAHFQCDVRFIKAATDIYMLPSLAVFADPAFLTVADFDELREAYDEVGPDTIRLYFVGTYPEDYPRLSRARQLLPHNITPEAVTIRLQRARLSPPRIRAMRTKLREVLPHMPPYFSALTLLSRVAYLDFERYAAAVESYRRRDAPYPQSSVERALIQELYAMPDVVEPMDLPVSAVEYQDEPSTQTWRKVERPQSPRTRTRRAGTMPPAR